jgi:hypothetical protein
VTLVLTLTLTRVGPTTVCRRGRRPCVATSAALERLALRRGAVDATQGRQPRLLADPREGLHAPNPNPALTLTLTLVPDPNPNLYPQPQPWP